MNTVTLPNSDRSYEAYSDAEKGQFLVEASELRLPPGTFPCHLFLRYSNGITVRCDRSNRRRFPGEVMYVGRDSQTLVFVAND